MRVLITGGAGSMGRELAKGFAERGDTVRAFDLPQMNFQPLEALGAEVVKGDINDPAVMRQAVAGTDVAVHLAALLPPVSERNRDLTFRVNVEGTRRVVEAVQANGGRAHLVFSSSVVTYGDTSSSTPPIRVDHPRRPQEIYAESKVAAEEIVLASGVNYTVLRIAGVSIPAFLNPPDPWPFQSAQRMEFINRADAVAALLAAGGRPFDRSRVLNIAGGPTWQMRGQDYVEAVFEAMDIPPEDVHYLDHPGWFDWYDTAESQALLDYQQTTFPQFLAQLRKATEEALA